MHFHCQWSSLYYRNVQWVTLYLQTFFSWLYSCLVGHPVFSIFNPLALLMFSGSPCIIKLSPLGSTHVQWVTLYLQTFFPWLYSCLLINGPDMHCLHQIKNNSGDILQIYDFPINDQKRKFSKLPISKAGFCKSDLRIYATKSCKKLRAFYKLKNNNVLNVQLKNNNVLNVQLKNNNVLNVQLKNNNVLNVQLKNNNVLNV